MLSYVTKLMNDAPDFRSSRTGLSFEDIVTSLKFVQSVDIARLSSYVESQSLTKDKDRQIEYYNYRIREASHKISELKDKVETVTNTTSSYEADPVVVVSSSDTTLEYEEKNEYYDTLVSRKISLNKEIAEANTNLNEFYLLLNTLQEVTTYNSQDEFDYADSLLRRLDTTISSWVELIGETTDEYFSTTLYSNAVKTAIPPQYYIDGGIVHIAKNIMIPVAALILIVLIWWFFNGVQEEIIMMRMKSSRDMKRKGAEKILF